MPAYIPELGVDGTAGYLCHSISGEGQMTTAMVLLTTQVKLWTPSECRFQTVPRIPMTSNRSPEQNTAKARSLMCSAIVCSEDLLSRLAERPLISQIHKKKKEFDDLISRSDARAVTARSGRRREDGPQSPVRRWQGRQQRAMALSMIHSKQVIRFLTPMETANTTDGEKWIDMDGDGTYTVPRGYATVEGLRGEQMAFDYTNGRAEPIYEHRTNLVWCSELGIARAAEICSPTVLPDVAFVDEGYIAPWDENDAQINYVDAMQRRRTYGLHLSTARCSGRP